MNPTVAICLCIFFIVAAFYVDCKKGRPFFSSILIPIIWISIVGSRPIGSWAYMELMPVSISDIEIGSLYDRMVLSFLIVMGIIVLLKREIHWIRLIDKNRWFFLFLLYATLSVIWSDYFWIAFKRWNRLIGSFMMVLIVLTEPDPAESTITFLKRSAFILIPLSVLVIKYYRSFGVGYNVWTGEEYIVGITTDKNALGRLCMGYGLVFIWDFATSWRNRPLLADKKQLLLDVAMLVLIFWLLKNGKSATSILTFIIGICTIVSLNFHFFRRNIKHAQKIFLVVLVILFVLEASFELSETIIYALGRDVTLTERTILWKDLLSIDINPFMGVGFGSFWLGERLQALWANNWVGFGEAHNGYFEIYLDLGLIGLFLFVGVIFSGYNKVIKRLMDKFDYARFQLGLFVAILFYNITESGFRESSLIWYLLLLIVIDYDQKENKGKEKLQSEI
jgi:exopolysaccharide production protein ExoQ